MTCRNFLGNKDITERGGLMPNTSFRLRLTLWAAYLIQKRLFYGGWLFSPFCGWENLHFDIQTWKAALIGGAVVQQTPVAKINPPPPCRQCLSSPVGLRTLIAKLGKCIKIMRGLLTFKYCQFGNLHLSRPCLL